MIANINSRPRFHYPISFAKCWSLNYRRMKFSVFKFEFVQEKDRRKAGNRSSDLSRKALYFDWELED